MVRKDFFRLIPAVYLILIRDNKILLLRRFQTGYEDGKYSLVAGHCEGNETMRQALVREVAEEAGITIDVDRLSHALTMHRHCGDHERLDMFFTTDTWDGKVVNNEPHKCDDLSWFEIDRLPENTIPYIQAALECYRRGEVYCEFNWAS